MGEQHNSSRISIMNFGKQLLGHDEKQSQMNNTWVPITPQKPILNRPTPVSDFSVNHMRRVNYQEFPVPGSENMQETLPLCHGPVESLHLMGQTGRIGEHRNFGGNTADKKSVLNHIAASYNQARHYESNGMNTNTLELLLNKNATNIASANRNLDPSNNMASRNPMIPKFHPQCSRSKVNDSYAGAQSNIHSASGIVNKEANRLLIPSWNSELMGSSEVYGSYAGVQSNIHSASALVNKKARLLIPSWNSELMSSSEVNGSCAGVQSNIHSASGIVNKEANELLIPSWNSELMGSSKVNGSYAGVRNIHSASGIMNNEANRLLIPSWNSELMDSSEVNGSYAGVQSNIHSASGIVNKEANRLLIPSWNSELMGSNEVNNLYAGVQSNIHSASGMVNKEANRLLIPPWNSELMGSSEVNGSYAGAQRNIHSASGIVNKEANELLIPSWNSELTGSNSDRWLNNDIHSKVSNQLKGIFSDIPSGDSYLYNLNHEPIQEADATNGFTNSLHSMPETIDQLKFLDNLFCTRPAYTLAESTSQEKDKQEDLISSTENEIQEYCDGLLQQIVDSSSAAVSTICEDQKGSASNACDQGSGQGFDLNKTPEHKAPKRRKHRPKVVVEAKPKSKLNPATQKTQIKKNPHKKRKSVPKSAPTPSADIIEESSDSTVANRKSCRKALNFDLENSRFESQSRIVCQQEIHHRNERASTTTSNTLQLGFNILSNSVEAQGSKRKYCNTSGYQHDLARNPLGTSLCDEISQADGHFKDGILAKGCWGEKRKRTEHRFQHNAVNLNESNISEKEGQMALVSYKGDGEGQKALVQYEGDGEGQKALVQYKGDGEGQKAVAQYKGDGSIVPYQEFELAKKHKPRPRVDLDPETERMWKQLMGIEGCEGHEEADNKKEKWWEEERNVFHGRVDSFIARMHLVQGDRRFSKWKGSVVDSVVGVFLTQNVSDHLSSSAFMCLAARFPLKSKSSKVSYDVVCTDTLVKEPELSIVNPADDTIISYGGATLNQPSYYLDFETPHHPRALWRDTETTRINDNLMKPNNQSSEEEFVSSQDSLDSSITQDKRITSSSGSNSESDGLNSRCEPSTVQFLTSTNSLHVGKTTMFQEFYNSVNGVSLFEERTKDGKMQRAEHVEQISRGGRNNSHSLNSAFNHPSSFGYLQKQPPAAPSIPYQLHYPYTQGQKTSQLNGEELCCPGTASVHSKFQENNYRRIGIWEVGNSADKPIETQYGNDTIGSPELPTMNPCRPLRRHSVLLQDTSQSRSHTNHNQLPPNHHLVDQKTLQSDEGRQHAESLNTSQLLGRGQENAINDYCNVPKHAEEGFDSEISAENRQVSSDNSQAVPKAHKQVYAPGPKDKESKLKAPKARKKKSDTEKKHAGDWDILRKEVQENETKKERSQETMDSLDYEAIRCASVKEISDAIVSRGMNNMLAERIKAFLNRLVEEHGSIDLEWLRHVPPDKAKEYLLSIRGLGLKSVECIRLLTLHHLAFPVDTNVGRIAVRLGWVPLQPLPETLQIHLLELYPVLESVQKYLWPRLCKLDQGTLYELHYQMITFGKVFCTKKKPNCNACPLRAECRHFASAFASARLALPGPEEKPIVSMAVPITGERNPSVMNPVILALPEDNLIGEARLESVQCEPIIEEPATPEQQWAEELESDIEDFGKDPDEIPEIKIDGGELVKVVQYYIQQYKESGSSKEMVAWNPESASIPTPKLKNVSRLRTEHQVYELPDSHPLLEKMDKREHDDPSPYLLAVWTPGETANSTEPPERKCASEDSTNLCNDSTCFSCNSIREANSQIVRGTLLIPCRTATRGSFPLNGTYFQVNEVFADHVSSIQPINVPRAWIWNLPRRTVYFGTSVSSIFKGLTTQEIQHCFWRGFVCVRGFDQQTRAPRPLQTRLHLKTTERKQE